MKKGLSRKILPYMLALSALLSGCGKKSECQIPTRHVHKYTKQINNDITIEKYLDSEYLNERGYNWNEDYVEINKYDEQLYELLEDNGLFEGVVNWKYLYNLMATHYDYLEFYYEYTETVTHTTVDGDGNVSTYTTLETRSGWTNDPYDRDNTGDVRLYHHKYYGYRVVYKDGKYKLERSPLVDDIRQIIYDYQYFPENCIEEVYADFKFDENELPYLSAKDFNTFNQPDLENKDLDSQKKLIR